MKNITWHKSKLLATWLLSLYRKQNSKQREMWAKMFHVLAAGSAVGVGMKYLTDTDTTNDISVIYWAVCAIIFHLCSIVALMEEKDNDRD